MRFKANINYGILAVFTIGTLFSAFASTVDLRLMLLHHRLQIQHGPAYMEFWILPLSVCSLLPFYFGRSRHYYEVQEGGLCLRYGRKSTLIPYSSLEKLLPISRDYGWFSSNLILVMLENGKDLRIAVAEKEKFLAEVSKRCPQLEQRGTQFGLSLQRAIL